MRSVWNCRLNHTGPWIGSDYLGGHPEMAEGNMRSIIRQLCAWMLIGDCLLSIGGFAQVRVEKRCQVCQQKPEGLTETYTRLKRSKDENQSAILKVTRLRSGRIRFHLTALWWPVGSDSPHRSDSL
jgi:hypothetical protein